MLNDILWTDHIQWQPHTDQTLYRTRPFTEFLSGFHRIFSGPVALGLGYVLLVETYPFPNLSLFFRTTLFEYPSVLSQFYFESKSLANFRKLNTFVAGKILKANRWRNFESFMKAYRWWNFESFCIIQLKILPSLEFSKFWKQSLARCYATLSKVRYFQIFLSFMRVFCCTSIVGQNFTRTSGCSFLNDNTLREQGIYRCCTNHQTFVFQP